MLHIYNIIEHNLLPALKETLAVSTKADFCVGFFNLRGWSTIQDCVEDLEGGKAIVAGYSMVCRR